jgi:hypothetical protein
MVPFLILSGEEFGDPVTGSFQVRHSHGGQAGVLGFKGFYPVDQSSKEFFEFEHLVSLLCGEFPVLDSNTLFTCGQFTHVRKIGLKHVNLCKDNAKITHYTFMYTEEDSYYGSPTDCYDLNKIFRIAEHKEITLGWLDQLSWNYVLDDERRERADLTVPIILCRDDSGIQLVDGRARVSKASSEGRENLPARFISVSELESCRVTNPEDCCNEKRKR